MQVGDVVATVDGAPVASEEGALRLWNSQRARSLRVTVVREGKTLTFDLLRE
jgi:hypothetical protein